jgi:hypothetical protein
MAGHGQVDLRSQINNIPGASLFKNLLRPEKQVSGHYSNPQFEIAALMLQQSNVLYHL